MQPRTRAEKNNPKHKEFLEKERLKNRTGGYFRYEHFDNPLAVDESCPSFGPRNEAYVHGDQVTEMFFDEREQGKLDRLANTEKLRLDQVNRENERWTAIEGKEYLEQKRVADLQADPMAGKKNVSGTAYNIITTEADQTKEGHLLRYSEECTWYKGKLRSVHLGVRGNVGFDCITGTQKMELEMPEKPAAHASIVEEVGATNTLFEKDKEDTHTGKGGF